MTMTFVILILVWSILCMAPSGHGAECGHVAFIRDFEKNNDVELRGYYFQPTHCFSVIIPGAIVGRRSSQPSSQHGFGSVISHENGGSYLLVQGDYGSWLDEPDDHTPRSLDKVVRHRLSLLEMDNARIIRKTTERMHLGSLSAIRLTVFYKCAQSQFTFVEESILALDSAGSVYQITLFATNKNYGHGSAVLEKVARSWKLEKAKCNRE